MMTPCCRYDKDRGIPNPEDVEQQSRDLPGFFKKMQEQSTNKVAVQEDIQELQKNGLTTAARSCATLPIVDALQIEVGARKQLVRSVTDNYVIDFLKERCPDLLTEDVVNNQAFITMLYQPIKSIGEYEKLNDTYLKGQIKQSHTSEFSKIIKDINERIIVLEDQLKDASKLEISLSAGLTQVNILCATKQRKLTDISTSG
eukprot:Seg2597.2 transcript_id=Seg2597.2/GoldUCD/mRNA.D3Y31 product="hypothetical protein" protein_id=Seg2597.2/GoldUCD/D3Y31